MGADEFYWSKADYNTDEIVNFFDYAMLADVWQLTDANISLDDDNDVDIDDLALFCEDWLWQPGWSLPMFGRSGGAGADFNKAMLFSPEACFGAQNLAVAAPATVNIKEILEWLDKIWLSGELKESMTEEEYLEFRKAIENAGF